jgi:threonylcarbamoyladenosine tRNA methylthiotransferase MtaB
MTCLWAAAFEELDAAVDASRNRAFLKIQEGCDQYCAYCIIPYARGHLRSRSLENIKEEVARLAAENYKEVVLIGIHLGCYGKEIPGGPRLSDAVKVALSVPRRAPVPAGSLESVEVEDELLKSWWKIPGCAPICTCRSRPAVMPPWPGCTGPYDTAKFAQLLQRIRSLVPNVAITTGRDRGLPRRKRRKISRSPWTSSGSAGSARSTSSPIPSGRDTGSHHARPAFQQREGRNGCTGWKPSDQEGNLAYREAQLGTESSVLWERRNKDNAFGKV